MKKYNWKYAIVGSLVILLLSIAFYDFSNVDVFNEKNISITNYDDGGTIGNSFSSLSQSSKQVCFTYTLGNKSPHPFAGVKINKEGYFNLENKIINLNLPSSANKRLHIFFTIELTDSVTCTFRHPIVCHAGKNNYIFNTKDFTVPSWWYKRNNILEDELPNIDFSKGVSIIVENNVMQERGKSDQICIQSIQIVGNNGLLWIVSGLFLFLFNLLIFILPYFSKNNRQEVIIEYKAQEINEVKPIDLEKEELAQITTYINQHYDNPELTLKVIKKALRIHENKISALIKDHFGISYKDYLHQIRITEAKRLFQEANLNINEVATLVGYGNISTFNRAFKAKEGITPSDFLNKLNT